MEKENQINSGSTKPETKPCECKEPSWCPRHLFVKSEVNFRRCQTREDCREFWDKQALIRSGTRPPKPKPKFQSQSYNDTKPYYSKPRSRYESLFAEVEKRKPLSIIEVGTWQGSRAEQMINLAKRFNSNIKYYGFDLFELLSNEIAEQEYCWQNRIVKYDRVLKRLKKTGAEINLIQGDTQETFTKFNQLARVDFIFIDGGHSEKTIQSDWNNSKRLMGDKTVVIFDDYYIPPKEGFGCYELISKLQKDERFEINTMKPGTKSEQGYTIFMVKVTRTVKKCCGRKE